MEDINYYFNARKKTYTEILTNPTFIMEVNELYKLIFNTLANGNKLILCGNGGSAADCQHIAAEFIGRFSKERPAWAALAICSDIAVITSLGNDYDYDNVFKRQIEALGLEKDLLLAISTSGKSKNIEVAIKTAKRKGMISCSITNCYGGSICCISDNTVHIPSANTQVVQEVTKMLFHIICEKLEMEKNE